MLFQNRTSAGKVLGEMLAEYKYSDGVVLAIAGGGVAVGAEIARELMLPLDVLVPRKIGHPFSREYSICVVDEKGTLLCDDTGVADVDKHWLLDEIRKGEKEAKMKNTLYRGKREQTTITGKTVIIVDDGAATGLTLRVALMSVEKERPKDVVIAAPIMPHQTKEALAHYAKVVTIAEPKIFSGTIGGYYEDFTPVSDEETIRILRSARMRAARLSVSLRSRWLRSHAGRGGPVGVPRSLRVS